ncbi:MAG: elongation factor G [Victivallales bacterium]|nr:elongation factor G [Victivallales bacterium]
MKEKTFEKVNDLSLIRNIGIIAHIDAGKTTLTERFLYYSGKTHKIGDIDNGNTVMDYLDEERSRGITIVSAAASFHWQDKLYHLIDTPGHIDFTAEVERSLRVISGAVVIFSAVEGVEAQSEKVWRQSEKYNISKIAFINKMDRMGASFDRVYEEIKNKFNGIKAVPMQIPVGEESELSGVIDLLNMKYLKFGQDDGSEVIREEIPEELPVEHLNRYRDEMLSTVAEFSDEIAELYLEEKDIPLNLLKSEIRRLVVGNKLCPVYSGSARKNIGVQSVMDAVSEYMPSPLDQPVYKGHSVKSGKEKEVNINDKNFCGLIFKLVASETADLLYMRTYSGTLSAGSIVFNPRTKEKIKIKRILRLYSKRVEPIEEVGPGDIVGLIGVKNTTTGDTLCSAGNPVALEGVNFPEPVISMAIEPKSSKNKDKLVSSLNLLCREDPTLSLDVHESTGQNILSGMGELHLEINCNRLEREFNLDIKHGAPRVVYRETLKQHSIETGILTQAIGETEYNAEVVIQFEPTMRSDVGIEVISNVKNKSNVPNSWLNSAEDALNNGLRTGGNWGYPLIYIKATILEIRGTADKTIDSIVAGAVLNGIQRAIQKGTKLYEPITKLEIMSPESTVGEITGFLQARRAVIQDIEPLPDMKKLLCEVPLSEMFGFSKALPKLSGGRASFSMEPFGYQEISEEHFNRIMGVSS